MSISAKMLPEIDWQTEAQPKSCRSLTARRRGADGQGLMPGTWYAGWRMFDTRRRRVWLLMIVHAANTPDPGDDWDLQDGDLRGWGCDSICPSNNIWILTHERKSRTFAKKFSLNGLCWNSLEPSTTNDFSVEPQHIFLNLCMSASKLSVHLFGNDVFQINFSSWQEHTPSYKKKMNKGEEIPDTN